MKQKYSSQYQEYLGESLKFGFINNIDYKNATYSPKILMNNPETGQHVLTDIQNELNKCFSFSINVAFVTEAGIGMLKTQFSDFADRGGHGRLMISPYLGFNQPKALQELLKLRNVEVRMAKEDLNSHAKVYMFNHGLEQVVIVGSSNLTHNALKLNYEWNIKLSSTDNGDFIQKTKDNFDQVWQQAVPLTIQVIEDYQKAIYRPLTLTPKPMEETLADYQKVIKPNRMQAEALIGLAKMRQQGAQKALIISATGTGKTYLSAFDVKKYQPDRFLFIVHREQILRKALKDYQRVIGFMDEEACIFQSGKPLGQEKYTFATIQSLSKIDNLYQIDPQWFDYILIDEVHKAGAQTYQRVIDYFQPKFLLGMTATPERTDDKNIYELFDYNIAYEIRLQEALDEDMLCPFLYYGVSELVYQGELLDDKTQFTNLVTDQRVKHIIDKIQYYGHSGEHVKGLIFCSKKEEARELSALFNQRNYRTVALTGEDPQATREHFVQELEEGKLDYIFTVDIFNEGIDIPAVNQVVMLRNTQSSIVFIQQLGRGLRKHDSKEFVTIIDFIGNYQNNYLIPIALFGDQSMNKDNYRRDLVNRNQLTGITTINFEEIAQQQIFDSIRNTNLSSMKVLREAYQDLANKLGRPPMLKDFILSQSIDPIVFFERNLRHYGDFLVKMKIDRYRNLSERGHANLNFLSHELLDGKRPHELLLLKQLMESQGTVKVADYLAMLRQQNIYSDQNILNSVLGILDLSFYTVQSLKKYGQPIIEWNQSQIVLSETFQQLLNNPQFRELVQDIIDTGLIRNQKYPASRTKERLELGEKYSRKDFCRLMGWERDESSTIYGYKNKYGTCPIFVTYHKSDEISESTQYGDRFINEQVFHWYTRSNRSFASKEVADIIYLGHDPLAISLFVKKEDGEGKDFYYLGRVRPIEGTPKETFMDPETQKTPVVTMDLKLDQPVPYNLMQYLLSGDQ